MMKSFEEAGQWWLPTTPTERIGGILARQPDRSYHLTVIGELGGDSSRPLMLTTSSIRRIHGQVGARAVTLDECLLVDGRGSIGGIPTARFLVTKCFIGAWFDEDEAAQFKTVEVLMNWLVYWTAKSGISTDAPLRIPSAGDSVTTVELRRLASEECAGPSSTRVNLSQTYKTSGDQLARSGIEQDFTFSVTAAALTDASELLKVVSYLQDLVCLGTGRIPEYHRIFFYRPDLANQVGGRDVPQPIEMKAQWMVVDTDDGNDKTLHSTDLAFSLADLGGMPMIEKWLEVAHEHRRPLRRAMATRYAEGMYQSDRLLGCAAALEAYDRLHPERRSLQAGNYFRNKVDRAIAYCGDPFSDLVNNPSRWLEVFKDLRNEIAHQNEVDRHGTRDALFAKSAFVLLMLCLLRDMGAPNKVIEGFAAHRQHEWVREHIGAYL